jgi:DnaJ-class molecular chaperone
MGDRRKATGKKQCSKCNGTGEIPLDPGYTDDRQVYVRCRKCNGTGEVQDGRKTNYLEDIPTPTGDSTIHCT